MDKVINNSESVTVVTKNEINEIMQIIYFDFDEYVLSEFSLNTLKTFLDKYQNQNSNYVIVGHADTNKELNFPDDPEVSNAQFKKWLKYNKVKFVRFPISGGISPVS